eukprot:6201329-Pleurochrysis_carterae.AAC.1
MRRLRARSASRAFVSRQVRLDSARTRRRHMALMMLEALFRDVSQDVAVSRQEMAIAGARENGERRRGAREGAVC